MEDVDTQVLNEQDDETTFVCDVCGDDHELLFLDSYLRETFRGHGQRGRSTSGEMIGGDDMI